MAAAVERDTPREDSARQNHAPSQPAAKESTDDDELVIPGNHLVISVKESPRFSGDYPVRRGGYIVMPELGRVIVAGKTLPSAKAAIQRALKSVDLPEASLTIERQAAPDAKIIPTIILSGEFRQPRAWRIPSEVPLALSSVVLASGGMTDKADLAHIQIARTVDNQQQVQEVNLPALLQQDLPGSDLSLSDGDIITITAGPADLVYVMGRIDRPGSFGHKLGESTGAYGAIVQRGGFVRFADRRKVHILRALPDGTRARLPVDVAAIASGQQPDIPLRNNDILVIPEKSWICIF